MERFFGKHWHHLPEDEVRDLLDSNLEKGLDVFEAKHRQERFGPNILTKEKIRGRLSSFYSSSISLNNPLRKGASMKYLEKVEKVLVVSLLVMMVLVVFLSTVDLGWVIPIVA